MRRFVACLLALPVLALTACSGAPTFTIRNPLQVDTEPSSIAGPRLMAVPQYYAPQYAPSAPAAMPAGYGYAAPAAGPCAR